MSECRLYRNKSDDKRVDKELTSLNTVNIEFKDDTDILRPVIKVLNFPNAVKANYCYLSAFDRYYFIREITASQQHLYMTLEIDPLYTYRSKIRGLNAIVKRQQTLCNYYLDDDHYKSLEYSRIQTKVFPYGFTKNAFLLTIAGGR